MLQDNAERIIQAQVQKLAEYHATGGALIAIRPVSGEILAMVGSPDFYNEDIDGQVNMATSPTRQPGSAIKPITYLAAFENGWTPGIPKVLLLLVTIGLLLKFKKLPEPFIVLGAAMIGLFIYPFVRP